MITNLDIVGVCRQLETASKWNRGRGGREKAAFAVNLRTILYYTTLYYTLEICTLNFVTFLTSSSSSSFNFLLQCHGS